jgi:two-component system nitrate/nitrite response regulator NarL
MLPTFAFVAEFESGAAALANHPAVDAVLLDPDEEGDATLGGAVDRIAAFVKSGHHVCVYTLDRRPYFLARCRRAGAYGMVLKSDSLDILVDCLMQVARGNVAISSNVALPASTIDGPVMKLTARQRQVLAGRARGEPFRRIARKLDISERTAHDHWAAVARNFAGFLTSHSPADLERSLGLDHGPAPLAPGLTLRATLTLGQTLGSDVSPHGATRRSRPTPQHRDRSSRLGVHRDGAVPVGTF